MPSSPSAHIDSAVILCVIHRSVQGGAADTIAAFDGQRLRTVLRVEGEELARPQQAEGHLIYEQTVLNRGIWAVPFSAADLTVTGRSSLLVPRGRRASVSQDGTLTYVAGGSGWLTQLTAYDPRRRSFAPVGSPLRELQDPAVSRDGNQIAVSAEDESGQRDIWTLDQRRGTWSRITRTEQSESSPVWDPAGAQLFFVEKGRGKSQAVRMSVAGSDAKEQLGEALPSAIYVSPSGDTLLVSRLAASDALWRIDLADRSKPAQRIFPKRTSTSHPRVSPDGQWIAYTELADSPDAPMEVYVSRYPSGEGQWRVSAAGGSHPRWYEHGAALAYISDGAIWRVRMSKGEAGVKLGAPEKLISLTRDQSELNAFDVGPDGRTLLLVRNDIADPNRQPPVIVVVENWARDLLRNR